MDYYIASSNFLHRVSSLTVGEHTLFSDHNPVILSLRKPRLMMNPRAVTNDLPNYEDAPFRYKISDNSLFNFKNSFEEPEIVERISNLHNAADSAPTTQQGVKELSDKITNLINGLAKRELDVSKQAKHSKPKFDAWFDGHCHTARRLFKRSIKVVGDNPDNKRIKARHRANSKGYRKIINKKKDDFFKRLNNKIKNGKAISWRDFKKLKSFKKDEVQTDPEQLQTF